MKKLVLLGSTGSIGTQTLQVIDELNEDWEVVALTANTNIELLTKQALKYKPSYLVIMNEEFAEELKYRVSDLKIKVLTGVEGLEYVAGLPEVDLVVNALVGAAGLKPTLAALKKGHRIGLANKESLVIGGEIINSYLQEYHGRLLPIDSEHNAIFQLLHGHKKRELKNIILTASGGPFRTLPADEFEDITVEEALNHPNWDMGGKITIDSATLMNKGLEVIEAHYLFNCPYEKIKVVIHPESIIHSMIEMIDGSILAEMGVADMRLPIQYVLTYPERKDRKNTRLNLLEANNLRFEAPDLKRFPALDLAYEAGKKGGTLPVVMNAANEVAVHSFLSGRIPFVYIPKIIEKVMQVHNMIKKPEIEEVYQVDNWARHKAEEVMVNAGFNS